MKFYTKTNQVWSNTCLMCSKPLVVIRESGEIYLSGEYTAEELQEILVVMEMFLTTKDKKEHEDE